MDFHRSANYSGIGPQLDLGGVLDKHFLVKLGYMTNSDLGNAFSFFGSSITKRIRGFFVRTYFIF